MTAYSDTRLNPKTGEFDWRVMDYECKTCVPFSTIENPQRYGFHLQDHPHNAIVAPRIVEALSIESISSVSAGVFRYTFVSVNLSAVSVGDFLLTKNTSNVLNTGRFIIVNKGADYVDVTSPDGVSQASIAGEAAISGQPLIEVDSETPLATQYSPDYRRGTGKVFLHSSNNNTRYVTFYEGGGTIDNLELLRLLIEEGGGTGGGSADTLFIDTFESVDSLNDYTNNGDEDISLHIATAADDPDYVLVGDGSLFIEAASHSEETYVSRTIVDVPQAFRTLDFIARLFYRRESSSDFDLTDARLILWDPDNAEEIASADLDGDGNESVELQLPFTLGPAVTRIELRLMFPLATAFDLFVDNIEISVVRSASGGGSGTGAKNFLETSDAENGIGTWATYADAAGTSPVDGTGGSPNVTFVTSNTDPLSGESSFLLTKDASNRQGQGFSIDFTIDRAALAKVCRIGFDLEMVSGSYADNDMSVWIYDVTNARLIQPSGSSILKSANGFPVSKILEFQTSVDSLSYRLIIHVASTNASAYSIRFDNFILGPDPKVYGYAGTDWTAWTPTLSAGWGTVTRLKARYRQEGQDYICEVAFHTGTVAASIGTISLPNGRSIDSSTLAGSQLDILGDIWRLDGSPWSSTGEGPWPLSWISTSLNTVYVGVSGNVSTGVIAQSNVNAPFGSTNGVYMRFRVPIAGLSSNVLVSSDTDTRVLTGMYYCSANKSSSTSQPIDFDTRYGIDTHACVTTGSSWKMVAPIPGRYNISGYIGLNTTSNVNISLFKNGVCFLFLLTFANSGGGVTNARGTFAVDGIDLAAGDYLDIRTQGSHTAFGGAITTNEASWISFSRQSGPAQVAASEDILASYYISSSYAVTVNQAINFDAKSWDSHNMVTPGSSNSWIGRAPLPGKYKISGSLQTVGTPGLVIYKNGSTHKYLTVLQGNVNSSFVGTIELLANETFSLNSLSSVTFSGGTAPIQGYIEIERIGN